MEEWKEKLIEKAEEKTQRAVDHLQHYAIVQSTKAHRTLAVQKRIIAALREKPQSFFGDREIFIETENHELVHDVAKTLGITLERSAQADGFNFNGKYEDINICVYGMQQVPHCRIVSKKVRKTVTVYKTVCNQEGEHNDQ